MKIQIVFLLFVLTACTPSGIVFSNFEQQEVVGVPSGSGLTKLHSSFYAVGDDSPFLFMIGSDGQIQQQIPLIDTIGYDGLRIPKAQKPDFEAMEAIGDSMIIVLGSGSKSPNRDVMKIISFGQNPKVKSYSTTEFYHGLRSAPELIGKELNIEGLAFLDGQLFILNRGVNVVFKFDFIEFLAFFEMGTSFPEYQSQLFELPQIAGFSAGFSGAVALDNPPALLFTASVEATGSAYEDGGILGSFVGVIDLEHGFANARLQSARLQEPHGPLKVESIAISKVNGIRDIAVKMITDDDSSLNSYLVSGNLKW
jgi:hypothetical protein